jgi:hypothetical protein
MATFPQSDDPNYPSSSGFYSDLYGGLLPDPKTLYTMARNSYVSPQTPEKMADVPTYHVVLKTPTLTIYADNFFDSFVVAIRGTADYTDFKAWLPTATSAVTLTDRWQKDFNDLTQFQKQFPTSKYKYYGVGHSLGGTIMDQFIKRGMIESGRSYNPAINLGDIPDADLAKKNARIYASGDPLYNLEGRLDHPTEVRPSPPVGWIGAFLRAKEQHSLLNPLFQGGAKTAEEKRAYQREYYRRHREEIRGKARAKRYGIEYVPEPLYESPFADEEHTVEQSLAHNVLQMLKKQKAEDDEFRRVLAEQAMKAEEDAKVKREEKAQRAKILKERFGEKVKKPEAELTLGSIKGMLAVLRKKHLKYDDEGEQLPLPKEARLEEQRLLNELERRKKDKKKR